MSCFLRPRRHDKPKMSPCVGPNLSPVVRNHSNTPEKSFTKFQELAAELRIKIWRFSCPDIRQIIDLTPTGSGTLKLHYNQFDGVPLPTLWINRESREETLKLYTIIHPEDFAAGLQLQGIPAPFWLVPKLETAVSLEYHFLEHATLSKMITRLNTKIDKFLGSVELLELRGMTCQLYSTSSTTNAQLSTIIMLFPSLKTIRIEVSIGGLANLMGYGSLSHIMSRLRRFIETISYIGRTGFENGRRPDVCVDVKGFLENDWTSWTFPLNVGDITHSSGNNFGPLETWWVADLEARRAATS